MIAARFINVDDLQPGDAEYVAWRAYANKLMARGVVSDDECGRLNMLAIAWGKAAGREPYLSGSPEVIRGGDVERGGECVPEECAAQSIVATGGGPMMDRLREWWRSILRMVQWR